ncbi:uncharacterized protein METZ01_LOCUS252671 [marine metagenome]|uniref:Uncharacterized protein n=1 Tax=marine metagenome TaxID=408172 RepID=A0A382IKS0_9ZZZZ
MPLVWNESLLSADKVTMTTPKLPTIKRGDLRWYLDTIAGEKRMTRSPYLAIEAVSVTAAESSAI